MADYNNFLKEKAKKIVNLKSFGQILKNSDPDLIQYIPNEVFEKIIEEAYYPERFGHGFGTSRIITEMIDFRYMDTAWDNFMNKMYSFYSTYSVNQRIANIEEKNIQKYLPESLKNKYNTSLLELGKMNTVASSCDLENSVSLKDLPLTVEKHFNNYSWKELFLYGNGMVDDIKIAEELLNNDIRFILIINHTVLNKIKKYENKSKLNILEEFYGETLVDNLLTPLLPNFKNLTNNDIERMIECNFPIFDSRFKKVLDTIGIFKKYMYNHNNISCDLTTNDILRIFRKDPTNAIAIINKTNIYNEQIQNEILKTDPSLLLRIHIHDDEFYSTLVDKGLYDENLPDSVKEKAIFNKNIEEKKQELINQKGKFTYYQNLIFNFLESGYTNVNKYCETEKVSLLDFQKAVEYSEKYDTELYDLYNAVSNSNSKSGFDYIKRCAEFVNESIFKGIKSPENDEILTFNAVTFGLSCGVDIASLETFLLKNYSRSLYQEFKKKVTSKSKNNLKEVEQFKEGKILFNDQEVSLEQKESVISFLKNNNIPLNSNTLYTANRMYLAGDIDLNKTYKKQIVYYKALSSKKIHERLEIIKQQDSLLKKLENQILELQNQKQTYISEGSNGKR